MNFTAMYVDIDEKAFASKSTKEKIFRYYVKGISIAEYKDNKIVFSREFPLTPAPKSKYQINNHPEPPYLYQCWDEIEPHIYNKTLIMHLANYQMKHLIDTFYFFKTNRISNPNYDPDIEISDENQKNIVQFPDAFTDTRDIRFDYLDLFAIFSRLFLDYNGPKINDLEDLIKAFSIKKTNIAESVGELFLKISKFTNHDSIIDIKHAAGITLGQVNKNIFTYKTKDEKNKKDKYVEYDKLYFPCIAINEDYSYYRKYYFDDLKGSEV